MTCLCDTRVHPAALTINAGLTRLPRQIATFDDFRRAMLAASPAHSALATWRARDDDYGVLLLELWAYACDLIAFYDEVVAHESYLRTSRLSPSIRKLVALLGYRPRPAVAARVALAVTASGRLTVPMTAGAAARSGAFDGNPPQLFELPTDATVHPLANQWTLVPPRRTTAGGPTDTTFTTLYLAPATARIKAGELVLFSVIGDASLTQIRRATAVESITADDGDDYVRVTFATPVTLNATPIANVRLHRVNERIGLWSLFATGTTNVAAIETLTTTPTLTLDGLYRQIKRNDVVLVAREHEFRWFSVTAVTDHQMQIVAQQSITVDAAGTANDSTVTVPAIFAPATRITLDTSLNAFSRGEQPSGVNTTWSASDAPRVVVYYGLTDVGRLAVPAETVIKPTDPLVLAPPVEIPPDGGEPSRFVLVDKNGTSIDVRASVDYATRALTLDPETDWDTPLVVPVVVYGNVIEMNRGETVAREILGAGDGSKTSQEFVLKKSPLTYLPVMAEDGTPYTSTLDVWVDDIKWTQVKTFYGVAPDAAVYVVRQDDAGKSHVHFGDGVRGRRLPSGRDNVRARYRFGGGHASPPANTVKQLAAPIVGIKGWWNPSAAFGGDDAEAPSRVRTYAPRSALVLGRAVSLADIEAVAASVGGARAVRADWRWHETQQRPVARVWYVGEAGVADLILDALRTVCDPSVPLDVEAATSLPSTLTIDIAIDEAWDPTVVASAVHQHLLTADTGSLTPERLGISRPLVRSRVFADVLAVRGTIAVRGLLLDATSVDQTAVYPGGGNYFDFETGSVSVNGVTA